MDEQELELAEKAAFLKRLGERIASIRKEKGLTGAEMARRCDLERSNLKLLESGKFNPSIWYLRRIAKGLEISIKELIKDLQE